MTERRLSGRAAQQAVPHSPQRGGLHRRLAAGPEPERDPAPETIRGAPLVAGPGAERAGVCLRIAAILQR